MIRRFPPFAGLLLLMALWAPPSAPAQTPSALIDSLGRALTDEHPGAAVIGVVAEGERSVRGFGAVDSSGAPPTAQTLFEIGSVTKTFTGLLLADAIERGLMQPDDPLRSFLPDSLAWSAPDGAPITLAQLATHRSGLPRLPSNLQASALANPQDPYANYSVRDLHAFLDGYTPPRAPGAGYTYSNLGTGLLGHVLAHRADTSFAALVQSRIADPLGLSDTRIDLTSEQQSRFAQGHTASGAPTAPWHFPALGGAGALRATPADMLTYVEAHLTASDDSPLGRAMLRAIAPHDSTSRASTQIGYGWHITSRSSEHTVVWHNGGTGGFSSFVGFNRVANRGVVVLASTAIGSDVTAAGFTLMEALLSTADPASDQP